MPEARRACLAVLLLVALSGCASLVGEQAQVPLSTPVEQRLTDLAERSARTEVELAQLRAKVVELETALARVAQAAAPRGEVVEQPLPVPLEPPLPPPPAGGRIEESELAEQLPEEAVAVTPSPRGATAEPVTVRRPEVATPAAQALYDRAYATLHQGRYAEAEVLFVTFLGDFAETDLADNAWYWIGESRLERGSIGEALEAFSTVPTRYPQGNKLADALLKIGECHELLGDVRAARQAYERLTRELATSPAAATAAERLRRLG